MLKDRLEAAYAVRDAYLPLKRGTANLSNQATACLALMAEQRQKVDLKPGAGAEALASIARGAAFLLEAERCFAAAHPELGELIQQVGLTHFYAYGDDDTPNPMKALRVAS